MANATQTGNWHWDRGMGNDSSEGSKVTLGMKATLPACFPPSMQHFRTWVLTSNSIRHVPLQRPWDGSIFLRSIKGQPSLTWKWARGRPETLRELRYSELQNCSNVWYFVVYAIFRLSAWEYRLVLAGACEVKILSYKVMFGSCDLIQRMWRYAHSKTEVPLERFCNFWYM